jgi:hypothetical protein
LATAGVVNLGRDPEEEPAAPPACDPALAADTAVESRAMFLLFADEPRKRRKSGEDVICDVVL